ncbi:hypothetical protein CRG98_001048 [Punica granatum]|uniref:Uncharacterized protein n=1 Tax=Punica granatum TaxID=22663 RepID=A0A2I0LCY2_PUNGR|nr:hypothetical protein CRG98_001048 [Punica granatum]
MAIAEGGMGPFFGRRCNHANDFRGAVGAVACDLFRREGKCIGEQTGLAGVLRAHRGTCTGCVEDACMVKVGACSHDAKGARLVVLMEAGREVFVVLIVVVQGSSWLLVGYFLQWEEE